MTTSETVVPFSYGWVRANGRIGLTLPAVPADAEQALQFGVLEQTAAVYCLTVDEKASDVQAQLFAENFEFTGVIAGVAAMDHVTSCADMIAWLENFYPTRDDQLRHNIGNFIVTEFADDSATALAYVTLVGTTAQACQNLASAVYTFTFTRAAGHWQVAALDASFDRAF